MSWKFTMGTPLPPRESVEGVRARELAEVRAERDALAARVEELAKINAELARDKNFLNQEGARMDNELADWRTGSLRTVARSAKLEADCARLETAHRQMQKAHDALAAERDALKAELEAGSFYKESDIDALMAERDELLAALREVERMVDEAPRAPETADHWLDRIEETARVALAPKGGE